MRNGILAVSSSALAVVAAGLYAPDAAAQSSLLRMHSEPGEFYLFDDSDVKVLDYRSERDVRICNDTKRHKVPLEVNYDGRSARVRPGDCFMFEAKTVTLSPAESLGSGWDLSGTIEHHATLRADARVASSEGDSASEAPMRTAEAPATPETPAEESEVAPGQPNQ